MKTLFVDVILPLHLPSTYTYRVPQEYNDDIKVGQRVVVQLGARKLYSAVVRRIHENVPAYKTKYVLSIIDLVPIVNEQQMLLWEWMARYYMCYVGDVMAVALPSALRIASESVVAVHPDFSGAIDELSENERKVLMLLAEHDTMTIADLSHALGINKMMPIINTMIEKQVVVMDEDMKQRFNPRTATYLTLNPIYSTPEAQRDLFDKLERKSSTQKQLNVMLRFIQLSHFGKESVAKKVLTDNKELSPSAISTLIKNEVLLQEERVQSRLKQYDDSERLSPDSIVLNQLQQTAYETLSHDQHEVSLLYGVTSSGKTEVYIRMIYDTLRNGKQALFLLPEIALTAQLINRLRRFFGNSVGIYHSRFSASQRAEVWQRTMSDDPNEQYNVLIGARSALFLPFRDLGLVVVDEEHDPSYKQTEPSPRYNGRDTAIYLAHIWGARTILGSATPSIESFFKASTGKYGFAKMDKRYGGLQLPEVLCSDLKEATRKREMKGYFSDFLIHHIQQALDNHEQVILFQNRRGFSLRIECDDCHWTPECKNCDVSLVYHKASNNMRCHYCGYSIPMPTECPACHSRHLSMKGFGTERIEEDLALLFPNATVARMDLDSTSQKNRYLEILSDFEERRIDILVGTQMVTKGLDFDNVSVVGILSADNMIHFPDYKAYERAFQLMTQVSGRAGRHGKRGKVIIQTYDPYHQAIRDVIDNNYQRMYDGQIQERRIFRYPPYSRLINISVRHKEQELLNEFCDIVAQQLRAVFAGRVLGPEYPSVSRIRGYYIKQLMIRFEGNDPLHRGKEIILDIFDKMMTNKAFSQIKIAYDVDPN
ncbi:MAG: primosomal protein N' [Bacteroidales bacterium]|nr:primosomal protein N' [Bacteroidales bacterium]